MQVDKQPFPINTMDLEGKKMLIRPSIAESANKDNVVIGEPRKGKEGDKVLRREVVFDKQPDGKEVLKYEKGNRGVRYVFKLKNADNQDLPKYVQFSDHNIAPKKAAHFHIFMGDNREKLLNELDNWPTYYPEKQTAKEIKADMLAH